MLKITVLLQKLMKKNNKIQIIWILFFFILLNGIYLTYVFSTTFTNKKDSDIIISIDDKVFTKFDLQNFFNIQKITGESKYKVLDNSNYDRILNSFIDYQLRKKIINYKHTAMTDDEMKEIWNSNKFKFRADLSLSNFCLKISVDKEFLIEYIMFFQQWQEYIMGEVVRDIKITDADVYEFLEMNNKDNKNFKQIEYSLYSITLYFNDENEKIQVENQIQEIKAKATAKNFLKLMKKYSQSNSFESPQLEKYNENELNLTMLNNIKKLNKNGISDISCSTENSGACMIFQLVDKQISQPQLTEQEIISIKNNLFIQQIDKKTHNLLLKKKNESNIEMF